MLEVRFLDKLKTAIVRSSSDLIDLETVGDIDLLWLEPRSSGDLQFYRPYSLSKLKCLYVRNCRQTLIDMVDASILRSLSELVVGFTDGCLVGLQDIGTFKSLERLNISWQSLTEPELDWIVTLGHLKLLAIRDSEIDDQLLARLSSRDCLKRLDISRTAVELQSAALDRISFPQLRSLDICNTAVVISAHRLDELFPSLERLIARNTQMSEEEFEQISLWPKLLVLNTGIPRLDFDRHGDEFWDL